MVTAVACSEHFGLGVYGEIANESTADFDAMRVLRGLLKPGGQLLISAPFGKAGVTPKHRVYDAGRLAKLLDGFRIERQACFRRSGGGWTEVSQADLAEVTSPGLPVNGVTIENAERV